MASFFKTFGKGVLAIILIPVFILVLAIMGVAGILGFIFMSIKGLVLFFTGRNLYDDLPEDKKARETINRLTNKINPEKQEQVVTPEPQRLPNQDPFYIPEYMREPPINQPDKGIAYNEGKISQQEPEWEEEILVPKNDTQQPASENIISELPGKEEATIPEPELQKEGGFVGNNNDFIPKMPDNNSFETRDEKAPEQLNIFDDDEGSTNFNL